MIVSVFDFVCTVCSVKTKETQLAKYRKAEMIEVKVAIVGMNSEQHSNRPHRKQSVFSEVIEGTVPGNWQHE